MNQSESSGILIKYFFRFVLLFLLGIMQAHAAKEPGQRLSFSISGGASLGAYEAGINWGLLTLMRDEAQKDQDTSGERYRPYEAASMTGASAGSINALLSALTWCAKHENDGGFPNRIDDNLFRNVWLSLDINNLLPPNATSPIYRKDDAVLSRKDLLDAAEMLRKTWNSPVFRDGCRIPLGVTLTRVFPQLLHVGEIAVKNQRFTIPFEFKVKDDLSAGFYFNPDEYYYHSDHSTILLPTEHGKTNYEISDQRIMQAILTSSAFPVAFGRKRLQYCRLVIPGSTGTAEINTDQNERLKGLSCPEGYELGESEFADGGLFDNLPIGLARTLAENNTRSRANPFPTTYIYLDPDRLRYEKPGEQSGHPCAKENPPSSCDEMEYSFRSEIHLLVDAFGTARTYELYRELSSETWMGNVVQLSRQFAQLLINDNNSRNCNELLPYFSEPISCADALHYAGNLLESAYNHIDSPVREPFSIDRLKETGLLKACALMTTEATVENISCSIDYKKFRDDYARRLLALIEEIQPRNAVLLNNIQYSQSSINSDRVLQVTSRGGPIVGKLLGAFAAFLDYKFREYDYYVGVYDAIVLASQKVCEQQRDLHGQQEQYNRCLDTIGKRFYSALGLDADSNGKYVFALLAKSEFESQGHLQFAYEPMPQKNNDIDAINTALMTMHKSEGEQTETPSVVNTAVDFFYNLKELGFTPTGNTGKPLMAEIMEDPETWAHELTLRFTDRLNYLEQESSRIVANRDTASHQQSEQWSEILGGSSYVLRSATYKYPSFDFAPSTAPTDWFPRNIIPYEAAIDLFEGDVLISWQPTWSVSKYNNIGIRGSIGIADGLIRSSTEEDDVSENYYAIGLDFTHLTNSGIISSWGITPTYYNLMETPETGEKDSFGGDIHIGFLHNRVRLAVGNKGSDDANDNWYFLIGLADLPGLIYWFTR